MPVWLEVLLNLSGYAGFVALASCGPACPGIPPTIRSLAATANSRAAPGRRAREPVGLDRDTRVLELRPQRDADHHESQTEEHADEGAPPIGVAVALMEARF